MNVLLLGSGGREHALAWKLAQSKSLDTLYAAPGNPGIAGHATIVAMDATDHAAVVGFCRDHAIGLVVIGPEAPLVDGLADSLRTADVPVFGPSRAAAQLEGSKGFTKDLCARAGIPTAGYIRVTDRATAEAALGGTFGLPVVIKADGLAAGKGVTVAMTKDEAIAAIADLFADDGGEAVIEEFLDGEEASLFVLTDGRTLMPFGSAQDHKRVGDGDTGPNTGGMGAYSPARVLTPELEALAIDTIVRPTVEALAAEGMPFVGVLYAGLMLTRSGPKLIEYNARFGDPEAQVLMPRFEGDLVQVMLACATGTLAEVAPPVFSGRSALTVVVAAAGYPAAPRTGGRIEGLAEAEATGTFVFQAGTRADGDTLRTSGGRVVAVTALGDSVAAAQAAAYRGVAALAVEGGFHRTDIGWREVERETR
ncbi:phosphoribosylamine--glycine ligase [Microvirga sp. SRT01]|uniref:Phosphoribosylamine--glycine ligase n=1 Tax=Sphingomonas longa TaxID=2778730 RepID=A0ABS2DAJ6_9SPHN|nr:MULTISPECIES: phosphoribosylamine--glycine ligase [Alphaproteobacteria]MBM6577959.1 phosphoribosylamine--glycine ligase [Sphingomonas sp. BT552]MBR7711000.1 phosphoribosylamine--glycine ligase [Microvirga sp. SRT01]